LTVTATGPGTLSYEWFEGESGDFSTPVGSGGSRFTTPVFTDDVKFWVRVSNEAGSADSAAAEFTVLDPVVIQTQPESQTVSAGDEVTFSVQVTGSETLSYQWYKGDVAISDETSPTLDFVAQYLSSGIYKVKVTNAVGAVFSDPATLLVEAPPQIIEPPEGGTYPQGGSLLLDVTAIGSPTLTYQWKFNGEPLVGKTSSSLSIPSLGVQNGGSYSVVVSNAFGSVEVGATVIVQGPPLITSVSAPETAAYGSTQNLSVSVVGPGPLQYFWYQGEPGDTSAPVGSGLSSLTTGTLLAPTTFWVRVTNAFGSVDSDAISIFVDIPAPVISSPLTASATVGRGFVYRITANNQPISFGADPIPSGLTFDATKGILSGVPSAEGGTEIALTASNSAKTGNATLNLTVLPPRPVLTSDDKPRVRAGGLLDLEFTFLNDVETIDFVNLPSWLNYDEETRRLTGTPTEAGVYEFQVMLTNAGGTTIHKIVVTVESAAGSPTIVSPDFVGGTTDVAFSHTFVTNPSASEFSLEGDLPEGIVWNRFTGVLSGLPTEPGSFPMIVRAKNASGWGLPQNFTLAIGAGAGRPVILSNPQIRVYVLEDVQHLVQASPAATFFEAQDLPPGIVLRNESANQRAYLEGEPLFPGKSVIRVRATGPAGPGAWSEITLDARPGRLTPVVSSGATANGRLTVPFSMQLTATEGPTSFVTTPLPTGLTLNATSGLITGTPTVAGEFQVSVQGVNEDGTGAALNMLFVIGAAPGAPEFGPLREFSGQVGEVFHTRLQATEDPVRFSALTPLPEGLALDSGTGLLAGTPQTIGRFEFVIEAESGFGFVSEPTVFAITVAPPRGAPNVTSAATATGTLEKVFQYSITAGEPFTAASVGTLPPGLTWSLATGRISGTPTLAGNYLVPIVLSNARGAGAPFELLISIKSGSAVPRITLSPSSVVVDLGDSVNLAATATNGPITAWRAASLPPGVTMDAVTGMIRGTPTEAGIWDARVSASNANGFGVEQIVRFIVKGLPVTPVVTSPNFMPWSTAGAETEYQITATNLPAQRPLPSGSAFGASGLPEGLLLDTGTGRISGKPKKAGNYTFRVWAENEDGRGAEKTISLAIYSSLDLYSGDAWNDDPTFQLIAPGFASGSIGVPFDVKPKATKAVDYTGYDGEYQYLYNGYSSSWGKAFDQTSSWIPGDTLRLNPIRSGEYYLAIIAWHNLTNSYAYRWVLVHILPGASNPKVTSPSEYSFEAGTPMTPYALTATQPSGGGSVYFYTQGELPPGLWIENGFIKGTVDVPGVYSFQLVASNAFGPGLPMDVNFFVAAKAAAPTLASVQSNQESGFSTFSLIPVSSRSYEWVVTGQVGEFLDYSLSAGEGIEEYAAENLPPGLILNTTTGSLSGIPEVPGTTVAKISARNAAGWGAPAEVQFVMSAVPGTPVITSSLLANATAGQPFTYTATASNSPISFNLGNLIPGFTANVTSGLIEGSFDQPGTYEWELSANNALGQGAVKKLIITVAAQAGTPVVADPGALTGQVGEAMTVQLLASGSPELFDVDGLPFGLTLDAETGEISGTPLVAGTFTYSVRASNAQGFGSVTTLSFTIQPGVGTPEVVSGASLAAEVGRSLTFALQASPSADSWSVAGVPDWLSVNTLTGVMTGTPTGEGTVTLQVYATNAAGRGATQTLEIHVGPSIPVGFAEWEVLAELPADKRGAMDRNGPLNLPNVLAYAMGLNPLTAQSGDLPQLLPPSEGENTLRYQFRRSTTSDGVSLVIRVSQNLTGWSSASVESLEVVESGDGWEIVEASVTHPGGTRAFLRLEAAEQ
jgi:hypothetical protein